LNIQRENVMSKEILVKNLALLMITVLVAAVGCVPYRSKAVVLVPPSVLHEPPPREALAMWRQADQQQAAGRTNQAIITLEQLAQAYPANAIAAQALSRVGKIYLEQGQPSKALRYYDYLLNSYPQWDDIDMAQVDWLKALWADGEKKIVFREGAVLQERLYKPGARIALGVFMAGCYRAQRDVESALDWLAYGFNSARTVEDRNVLSKATREVLQEANQKTVKRLLEQNPPDFLRIFLEFRLAQLEMDQGQQEAARQRLVRLQAASKSHPLAGEIQAALKSGGSTAKQPTVASFPQAPQEPKLIQPLIPPGPSPTPPQALPPPPPMSDQSIPLNPSRIGCLVPLNGQYAAYGRQVVHGVTLALEDYNQRHPDQQITLVTKDTKDDPETTLRSFQELTHDQGVVGIVGPLSNQCLQAIAEPANQLGIPLLSLTQADDEAPESSYIFHVFIDNRQMLKSLVQYCRSKLGFKNFAALYPNDRYGQKLSKAFDEVVNETGGHLLANVAYNPASSDFQEPIQKLLKLAAQNGPAESVAKGLPFEALFIPDQARTVAMMAPQLPHNNIVGVQLLGTNLWSNPELVKLGGIYVEQAIFPSAYYAGSQDRKTQHFEERFKELYQDSPAYLEAQAYDAMTLLLRALERTQAPVQRAAVVQKLLEIKNYDGLTGTVSFAPDGHLERRYMIFQVNDGRIAQIAK
jgi:branched-chain amino acid transport system substrate-binding protein